MVIVQNSMLVRFFLRFWTVLVSGWQGSVPGRIAARWGAAIRRGVAGSWICQFVWRDGAIARGWPHSLTCRGSTAVLNLPVAFVQWIYKLGKSLFDNSVGFRFFSALGGGSFVFLGLSMLLMLIVPHESWNNANTLLCMYAVVLLFLAGCAARPRHRLDLDQLGPYFTLFMGFICYGLIASLSTSLSMRFFAFYIISFLIALLTVSTVQKLDQLQLVVVIAVAGLTVAALYGCYQGYIGVEVVANQQDMILNPNMPGRIYSFFDNPNNFGEILVMLMPFLLALLLNAKTWRGRLLAVAAMVPSLAAIGLTYSRSGWIGLVIAVVVFLILLNWRFLPLFIVLGLLALPILPESIMKRILTIGNMKDSSTQYRFSIYQDTAYLVRDYGFRGVGLGTDVMKQVFQVYPTMFDGNYPIHTHNNYLQMLGELGIFGGLAYLAMVLHQIKAGVKQFYACTDRRIKNMLAAAVGAFCGISVISVAEYTWFYARNQFVYFFLFGIIAACIKLAKTQKSGTR